MIPMTDVEAGIVIASAMVSIFTIAFYIWWKCKTPRH